MALPDLRDDHRPELILMVQVHTLTSAERCLVLQLASSIGLAAQKRMAISPITSIDSRDSRLSMSTTTSGPTAIRIFTSCWPALTICLKPSLCNPQDRFRTCKVTVLHGMLTTLAFEQTHRKFVALKAGATPFRTVFQLSSVGYVSRSRPPPLATTWDLFLLSCPL